MQTFLPFCNFNLSAKCLDYRRLGKQRVEAYQIINVLEGKGKRNKNGKIAWENHPAVKMWKGYELALKHYFNCILSEWIRRGYNNTMSFYDININNIIKPSWLGDNAFHNSHKSNLLRKDPNYYSEFRNKVPNNLEYVWPVK